MTWLIYPNGGHMYENIWNILRGEKKSSFCQASCLGWTVKSIPSSIYDSISCYSKTQVAFSLWSNPKSNYSLQWFMMYRTNRDKNSLLWP